MIYEYFCRRRAGRGVPDYKRVEVARLVTLALLVGALLFQGFGGDAQTLAPVGSALGIPFPFAAVRYGANYAKSLTLAPDSYPDHQDFCPIAVFTDQALLINLQFSRLYAGQSIQVGVDDGAGVVSSPTNSGAVTIASDGSVSIAYTAPHTPGHCRVAFRFGSQDSSLPLAVLDPSEAGKPTRCLKAQ